jgi:glycosyltransferase involved in cell wall biosynthesis
LVRTAAQSVAVSPSLAHVLRGLAPGAASRVAYVPNAVVTRNLLSARTAPRPVSAPERFVVWVGRMVDAKDPQLMVRTAALLHQHEEGLKTVMIGDGPLLDGLRTEVAIQGLADVVLLPGFIEAPYPWMSSAEALVLTSRREGLGNVLIEAGALGTPIVSVDCPSGPSDVLRNRSKHRLVAEREPEAIAEAVMSVLSGRFESDGSWDEYELGVVSAAIEGLLAAVAGGSAGKTSP